MEANNAVKFTYMSLVICTLITASTASYIYFGSVIASLIVSTGLTALAAWCLTTFRRPQIPDNILVIYLITVVLLLVQNVEEWLQGFAQSFIQLFPQNIPDTSIYSGHIFFSVFSIGAVTLFIFASVGVSYKHHLGNYMAWFLFAWAVLGGAAHYVYPFLALGRFSYMPGQISALPVIASGLFGITRLLAYSNNKGGMMK